MWSFKRILYLSILCVCSCFLGVYGVNAVNADWGREPFWDLFKMPFIYFVNTILFFLLYFQETNKLKKKNQKFKK